MGVIHKLKEGIRDFILERKKTEPNLSCRQVSNLILEKFQVEVSKSSVNAIMKTARMSMPVGRRLKKRKKPPTLVLLPGPTETPVVTQEPPPKTEEPIPIAQEPPPEVPIVEKAPEISLPETEPELPAQLDCTGAILLKAADYLMGGSRAIFGVVKNRLTRQEENFSHLTEALIYLGLFEKEGLAKIWPLIGKKFSQEALTSFLNELENFKTIGLDIYKALSAICQEARCVKATLSDGANLYLDGQLHTIWSTPHIPYDFSDTFYNIKDHLNKYFWGNSAFNLFMAPGYDTPTKEFFDFILGLEGVEKRISKLTLYGNKFEELENIRWEKERRRSYIFGMWPWQFVAYRKVKTIGEFRPFRFQPLKSDFYLADIEIDLSHPAERQTLTLKGCALKKTLSEKTRLVILGNLPREITAEEIANSYLGSWPNLEEAFGDYSRKIELFTYTANAQHFFSAENPPLEKNLAQDIKGLFDYYLKALDLYVRWHFLPSGYENKDFAFSKEQFYALDCRLKKQEDSVLATFAPHPGYAFLKDLEYACRRLNEKGIEFSDGKKLWCNVK